MRTASLSLAFVTALLLASPPAPAQALPDSLTMSCAAASDLVRREGAVVIGTGPYLYQRYVTRTGYCQLTQTTEPAWIPTADQKQCLVGRLCRERRVRLR